MVNIFLYGQVADLRRGFDGLATIVQEAMGEDPLSGSLFIFLNRRRNRIKLLYWDTDGQQAETIDSQHRLIEKLQHELDLFKRHIFGQRRERFIDDPRQGKLFEIDGDNRAVDEARGEEATDSSSKKVGQGHGRRRLPESFPRRPIIYELNDEERRCPCCGKQRVKVSEEISEQLEFQPASFYVTQHIRCRVNWLFVGSDRGGETAAVLYTLVATCKRLRIDPFAYLRDVFQRLPQISTDQELEDLLPDRWIQQHPKHRLVHREKQASQAKQRRRQRRARRRELEQARAK